MKERRISFKTALNEAVRRGLAPPGPTSPFCTPTADLGLPTVRADRALQLAAELEDEVLVRKQRLGK